MVTLTPLAAKLLTLCGTPDDWLRFFATAHTDPVIVLTGVIDWLTAGHVAADLTARLARR